MHVDVGEPEKVKAALDTLGSAGDKFGKQQGDPKMRTFDRCVDSSPDRYFVTMLDRFLTKSLNS